VCVRRNGGPAAYESLTQWEAEPVLTAVSGEIIFTQSLLRQGIQAHRVMYQNSVWIQPELVFVSNGTRFGTMTSA
jgi:hypothetical protein